MEEPTKTSLKTEVKDFVKHDLVGSQDWKSSKLGALFGIQFAARSVGSVFSNASGSFSRLSSLVRLLSAKDELPNVPLEGSATDKFRIAQDAYGMTEAEIAAGLTNTYRAFWLYLMVTVIYTGFVAYSLVSHPPADLIGTLSRFGVLPIAIAMLLKQSYTNWMLRRRVLGEGMSNFLKTMDFIPKK